jgi:hypothetical protein
MRGRCLRQRAIRSGRQHQQDQQRKHQGSAGVGSGASWGILAELANGLANDIRRGEGGIGLLHRQATRAGRGGRVADDKVDSAEPASLEGRAAERAVAECARNRCVGLERNEKCSRAIAPCAVSTRGRAIDRLPWYSLAPRGPA